MPSNSVSWTRAVRATLPAPGHSAGGHHHRAHVRLHAQAAGQALPLPHRRTICMSHTHALHHITILIRNVPLFTMIV